MTLAEYNRLDVLYNTKTEQQLHEESKFVRENADEIVSKYRREQLKAKRAAVFANEAIEKEIERESYTVNEEPDPEPTAAQPYGKWRTVVEKYV